MKKLYCFSLIILLAGKVIGQANFDTVRISSQKLTDNIYMLKGSGGNIGVLIGKEGTLMIDDQFAPLSNKINGAVKTIDPGEIRFLVNTHLHGDHSGGNENFKKMGVTIVAHDQARDRMMKESKNGFSGGVNPARDPLAWPVITFADKINFHLNNEDIEVLYLSTGHTDGDVTVHFKKANIFHMGDAFVRYGYPFIDVNSGGSFIGFITTLDKALALMDDNSKVIPGHGELATKADVKALRDKLADIRDQVLTALKKGKKVEDIPAMGITDKYEAELGKGFLKGKDFVMLAANELKATLPKK